MLMDLNFNIIILASDAHSYYDAYQVLREKTDEIRRIKSKKEEEHQKKSKVLVSRCRSLSTIWILQRQLLCVWLFQ